MCHQGHPSLLGLQRWGAKARISKHCPHKRYCVCILPCSQKCAFLLPLPTPNLNHSNQLQGPSMQRNRPPNVASPNNAAPKCGVTGKCGVTKQCGANQCGAKMWRHQKMWCQRMRRQNVASQEKLASPENVAPPVIEMCLRNVFSASGGKVDTLLPTPCESIYELGINWHDLLSATLWRGRLHF